MKFPHPLTLLCGCVLLAAAASHVLPPGQYDRRDDPATSRKVVVAGTYHTVAPRPVGQDEPRLRHGVGQTPEGLGEGPGPVTG